MPVPNHQDIPKEENIVEVAKTVLLVKTKTILANKENK
jgi:hypothetical protein